MKISPNVHQNRKQNIFIAIHPAERVLLVGYFLFFLLVTIVLALQNKTIGAGGVILALTLHIGVRLLPLFLFRKNKLGWFHPVIFSSLLLFIYDLWVEFPIYAWGLQYNQGLIGYSKQELAALVVFNLLLGVLSQITYYIGYLGGPRIGVPNLRFKKPKKLLLKTSIIIAISVTAFLLYLSRQGGVLGQILFLGQGRTNLIRSGQLSGEWVLVGRVGIIAWLIFIAYAKSKSAIPFILLFGAITIPTAYLASGSRSQVIVFTVIGMIIWFLKKMKISYSTVSVIALGAVILLGTLGAVRRGSWTGEINISEITGSGPQKLIMDALDELAYRYSGLSPTYPILAKVPDQIDFLYGDSYIALFVTPIPRAIWPEKPRTTGAIIGELFLNTAAPVPPSPIAEAYWNLGIPGVIILFILYGIFHHWLAHFLSTYSNVPAIYVFYAITIFQLTPAVLFMVGWIQNIVILVFLLFILGIINTKSILHKKPNHPKIAPSL